MLTIVVVSLCFLLQIPKIASHILNSYISADYLGAHSFVHDNTEYILYGYAVAWHEARVICLGYNAELATVDTHRLVRVANRVITESDLSISDHVWIGAREDYPNSWFWISGGNRTILRNVSRRSVSLRYSNSSDENLRCLSIDRVRHDASVFVSLRCNQRKPFMCQRTGRKYNDKDMKMMSSTRIDEKEFVLYSTRLTWPEAVINCRKEGLQIAEVKTIAEAQSLAFLMIRTRPESIENAWIGGYADDSTWKWLPSDSNISNNDLWKDDSKESRGCLLLDRHVCELPVYLVTKCDRKRDVICQRPSKKQISEKPVPVYVEGCPYWIGFHARTWLQAQYSCNEFNASLVVLDSPKIINHMMSLMEDNREELRHIWTDGRRKLSQSTVDDTTTWKWIWRSTGEPVLEGARASFVPWCVAEQCRDNDANCLNLDRAGYDAPVVYGLSCHQSQTYVCQPWSGACVGHRPNLKVSSASLHEDDDLPRLLPPTEHLITTTASYHNEAVNQKTLHAFIPTSINASRRLLLDPPSRFIELLGDNIVPSSKSNDTFDGLILKFQYLPFRVLDGRSTLHGNVKMYPWTLRPLVYPLINRYFYYPRRYVRPD